MWIDIELAFAFLIPLGDDLSVYHFPLPCNILASLPSKLSHIAAPKKNNWDGPCDPS